MFCLINFRSKVVAQTYAAIRPTRFRFGLIKFHWISKYQAEHIWKKNTSNLFSCYLLVNTKYSEMKYINQHEVDLTVLSLYPKWMISRSIPRLGQSTIIFQGSQLDRRLISRCASANLRILHMQKKKEIYKVYEKYDMMWCDW